MVSAALVIGLTGCAQESSTPESPATASAETTTTTPAALPTTFGPGEYYFEYMGATGTITLPSDPVADIEEIREMAGADPVTYATVNVDNRKGSEPINMYQMSLYSPEGEEFIFSDASSVMSEWDISTDDVDAYNRAVDVNNKYLDDADPLQAKEFVMVGQFAGLPEEYTGVVVMPSGGFDSVLAVPEDLKDQYAEMTQDVAPQPAP